MTVLMREEMNDADIAWAAADASVGNVMQQLLTARQALGLERESASSPLNERHLVEPAVMRARGAL